MVLFQLSRSVSAFSARLSSVSGLGGSQQAVPQLIMDVHFRSEDLFIQIDFHDAVQQGFLPLLHLAGAGWCSRTVLR